MPPRQPELPEGTDHVVRGASGASRASGAGGAGGAGGGLIAKADAPGAGTDRLVSQVRDQVAGLRDQAGNRIRGFADGGKERATGLLEDFSEVITDAARSVDQKFGADYGEFAHRAAGAVSGLADKVRSKSVDDLIDDTREFVRKSPGIAIGIAAIAGFALVRVIKTGLDDARGARGAADGVKEGGG